MAQTDWSEFTNNFATDIAPIIALFGEQVTKQFLSESTNFLEAIVFGVAPLGILTAVVSVIRIYGNSSLKSLVGRAKEAHGAAEAELCSSTSEDVCELWSNGGICRVFGRPKILEFFYDPQGNFRQKYKPHQPADYSFEPAKCGIEVRDSIIKNLEKWHMEKRKTSLFTVETVPKHQRVAPYPNLSLNIGVRQVSRLWLVSATLLGVLLQLSFFGYATWSSFYHPSFYEDPKENPPVQAWSFWVVIAGTILLNFGMIFSAALIEGKSRECWIDYVQETQSSSPKDASQQPLSSLSTSSSSTELSEGVHVFWLQPGGQRVGDQLFNSFAFSDKRSTYVTSWKVEEERTDEEQPAATPAQCGALPIQSGITPTQPAPNTPQPPASKSFRVLLAITSTIIGFILQFVGLRGLHGSVALYQVASTLFMAMIRAFLRIPRLQRQQNKLGKLKRTLIEDHELDWQAINLEASIDHPDDNGDTGPYWYIAPGMPPRLQTAAVKTHEKRHPNVEVLMSPTATPPTLVAFRYRHHEELEHENRELCFDAALDWIQNRERESELADAHPKPNLAARIMHYRSRLAYLTGKREAGDPLPKEQRWDTEIRRVAVQLRQAISNTSEHIFSRMNLEENWENVSAVVWSANCNVETPGKTLQTFPIYFVMVKGRHGWVISEYQLEAVLGLWLWSLELKPYPGLEGSYFNKKSLLVSPNDRERYKATIKLWCPEVGDLTDHPIRFNDLNPDLPDPWLLSIPTNAAKFRDYNAHHLTVDTCGRPIDLLAQDIFGAFVSSASGILKPLNKVKSSQPGSDSRGETPNKHGLLGLVNNDLQAIASEAYNANLGLEKDIMMSLVPALLPKLPSLEEALDDLLVQTLSLKKNGNLKQSQSLLQSLLSLISPQFQDRIARNLGELYRAAIQSNDEYHLKFGWRGLDNILNNSTLSNLSSEARSTLEHYEALGKYLLAQGFNAKSTPKRKPISSPDKILNALRDNPATNRGLNIPIEYDISETNHALTILRWAVQHRAVELIGDLSYFAPSIIHDTEGGKEDRRPIFWPLTNGFDQSTFETLLEWPGVDINVKDHNGYTPLLIATKNANYDAVKLLLESDSSPDRLSGDKWTALTMACHVGSWEIFKSLVDAGASLNQESQNRKNGLIEAIKQGHSKIVKFLVNNNTVRARADVNYVPQLKAGDLEEGDTALSAAIISRQFEIFEWLIRYGHADVNLEGELGTPLAIAAANGLIDYVKFLVITGKADVNKIPKSNRCGTALIEGAASPFSESLEIVDFLVSQEAEVNAVAYRHTSDTCALREALFSSSPRKLDVISYLLNKAGATIQTVAKSDRCHGHREDLIVEAVKGLLPVNDGIGESEADNGHASQQRPSSRLTPEVVQTLIHSGTSGFGPSLVKAAHWGDVEFFHALMKYKDDLNVQVPGKLIEDALRCAREGLSDYEFRDDRSMPSLEVYEQLKSRKQDVVVLLEEQLRNIQNTDGLGTSLHTTSEGS